MGHYYSEMMGGRIEQEYEAKQERRKLISEKFDELIDLVCSSRIGPKETRELAIIRLQESKFWVLKKTVIEAHNI